MRYIKWVDENLASCHGGTGRWLIGVKRRVWGKLRRCGPGIHVCRWGDPHNLQWLAPRALEVQVEEAGMIDAGDKLVVRAATPIQLLAWDDMRAGLFKADCAERVLHLYESERPGDARPREAIEALRRYALGQISLNEAIAARLAAKAAWTAEITDAVSWGAVSASGAAWNAISAAIAFSVANVPSVAAAAASSGADERRWQCDRLMSYLDGGLPAPARRILGT